MKGFKRIEDSTIVDDQLLNDILNFDNLTIEQRNARIREIQFMRDIGSIGNTYLKHLMNRGAYRVGSSPPVSMEKDTLNPEVTTQSYIEQVPPEIHNINNLRFSPHYDVPLLSKQQAREVIGYIYNRIGEDPDYSVLSDEVRGIPNTFLTSIVAQLGELVYGPNNYIGPSKTGNAEGTLLDIITNVPALNDADARARLHDIALAITTDPIVHEELPPVARELQVFEPLFRAGNSDIDIDHSQVLKLSGDVEENPGLGPTRFTNNDNLTSYSYLFESWHVFTCRQPTGWEVWKLMSILYDAFGTQERVKMASWMMDIRWRLVKGDTTRKDRQLLEVIHRISNDMNDISEEDVKLIRMKLKLSGNVESNPGPPAENNNGMDVVAALVDKVKIEETKASVNDKKAEKKSKAAGLLTAATVPRDGAYLLGSSIKTNKWSYESSGPEMDAIVKILSSPTNASSYLSQGVGTAIVDMQAHINDMYGNFDVRRGQNNTTDKTMPSSNWIGMAGWNTTVLQNGAFNSRGTRLFRYGMSNKEPRTKIPAGNLGTALDGAAKVFQDFLSVGRTNTNAFSGDPMLEINSRLIAADFGDYINLAKLLAYTSLTEMQYGDVVSRCTPDLATYNTEMASPSNVYYPGSANQLAGGARPAITAWFMHQTLLRQIVLGQFDLPNNLVWNDTMTTAFIPVSRSVSPDALALITMCYMEYPMFSTTDANLTTFSVQENPAAGLQPNLNQTRGNRFATENVRVDGPKFNVIYITLDNIDDDLELPNGTLIPDITNAGVNISAELESYYDNNIPNGSWFGYQEAMDYFLKFTSADDWVAACCFAHDLIRAKLPYYTYMAVGGAPALSMPVPIGALSGGASIQVQSLDNLGQTAIFGNVQSLQPLYNSFGYYDYPSQRPPEVAAPANGRPITPITAWFQDNTPLTRWGILTGCLKKDVISGTSLSDMYKDNRRPIYYAILKVGEILLDMSAEWYIKNRITNKHLHGLPPKIIERRTAILKKLAGVTTTWQQTMCGFVFMRMADSSPTLTGNYLNDGIWFNADAWRNSQIVLSNKMYYNNYFQVEPQCTMQLGTIYNKTWMRANSPQAIINGVATGGPFSQCLTSDVYKGNSHMDERASIMYAMSKWKHLADGPLALQELIYTYLVDEANKNVFYQRPILQYWSEWLNVYDGNTLMPQVNRAIGGMITTIPHYPEEYDDFTGFRMLVGIQSMNTVMGTVNSLNLKGLGSGAFINTTSYTAPGDDDLMSSPGQLF